MPAAFGPLKLALSLASGDPWTGIGPLASPADWTGSSYYQMDNTPANFIKMSGTIVTLSGHLTLQAYANDTVTLTIRIVDAALNPLTTLVNYDQTALNITTGVTINYPLTLTAAGIAADKATWDAALIELVGTQSASMGSDHAYWEFSSAGFPAISGQMYIPPTIQLDTLEAAEVWSATPDLKMTGFEGSDPDLRFDVQVAPSTDFLGPVQLDSTNLKSCYYYRGIYQGFKSPGGLISGVTIFGTRATTENAGQLITYLYGCNGDFDSPTMTPVFNRSQGVSQPWANLPEAGGSVYIPFITPYMSAKDEHMSVSFWYTYGAGAGAFKIAYDIDGTKTAGTGGFRNQLGTSPTYSPFPDTVSLKFEITGLSPLLLEASSFGNPDFSSIDGEPYAQSEQVTWTMPDLTEFLNNITYYWRARVNDPNGTNVQSDWTAPRSFVYKQTVTDLLLVSDISNKLAVPDVAGYLVYYGAVASNMLGSITLGDVTAYTAYGAVVLTAPADAAPAEIIPVVLTWDALSYTQEYQIQISLDAGFTSIVIDEYVQFNTYTFGAAAPVTEYFWRVRAVLKFT